MCLSALARLLLGHADFWDCKKDSPAELQKVEQQSLKLPYYCCPEGDAGDLALHSAAEQYAAAAALHSPPALSPHPVTPTHHAWSHGRTSCTSAGRGQLRSPPARPLKTGLFNSTSAVSFQELGKHYVKKKPAPDTSCLELFLEEGSCLNNECNESVILYFHP